MFRHPDFNFENISHKFFNKQFIKSTHLYIIKPEYNIEEILKNRKLVEEDLNAKSLKIVKQIHSNIVYNLEDGSVETDNIEADAIVTSLKNIAIAVNTADCVPVLFADPVSKVIGAAHAGWKGALSNILKNTIKAMIAKGAKLENIQALIGPCIHKESYEVSQDLYEHFLNENAANQKYFEALYMPNKYLFDLRSYVRDKLEQEKLQAVFDINQNTLAMPSFYSSYRRSSLGGEQYKGSLLSTIVIK
jgi:polyphenol oxidase